MSRVTILGTLVTGLLVSPSWAQIKTDAPAAGPPFPGASEITFQWDYSCASGRDCSFTCLGTGGASHVTKLTIYLGTIPVGSGQKTPAVIYEFSTREIPRANGFSVSSGLGALSCQVNGLTLDYSGPPRDGRRTMDTTGSVKQNIR